MDNSLEKCIKKCASWKHGEKTHLIDFQNDLELIMDYSNLMAKKSNKGIDCFYIASEKNYLSFTIAPEDLMAKKIEWNKKVSLYDILICEESYGPIRKANIENEQIDDFGKILGEMKLSIQTYILKNDYSLIAFGQKKAYYALRNDEGFFLAKWNDSIQKFSKKIRVPCISFDLISNGNESVCRMVISNLNGQDKLKLELKKLEFI